MDVKYPDIEVQLTGLDSNALVLVSAVKKALQRNNVPREEIDEFFNEALSGDYDHVLQTCMKTVNVS